MLEISVINSDGKKVFDSNNMVKKSKEVLDANYLVKTVKDICANEAVMRRFIAVAAGVTTTMLFEVQAFADPLGDVSSKINVAVNPIIELLASLGYPITYGVIIVAAFMIITGRKKIGIEMLKWAAVGYLTLQFAPVILQILDTIGKALRSGLV